MDNSYPKAIAFVLKQEGGYGNDPKDPGGPTNFGITIIDARKYWKSDASAEDVRAMPLSVAKDIYYNKYWLVVHGPDLPAGLDLCTMDSGVNSGVGRSNIWLGKAIGSPAKDYVTLAKQAQAYSDKDKAIDVYCDTRLNFLHSLKTWSHFGKGWGRRVADLRALAHVLWLQASGKTTSEIKETLGTKVAQSKSKQATDLPTATVTTGGQATGHFAFWQWDLLHVGILIVGVVISLYFIRKVFINANQVKAYEAQIEALSAVIPDAHV